MCRFISYLGSPVLLSDLVVKPKNSLIRQSIKARETDEPLNGDGFGIGWYVHEIDRSPAMFTSVRPAWNDRNLMYLSAKIRSSCIFAHVRAATEGGVSEVNCHPFHFGNYLFMHNGSIGGFAKIKRLLRNELSDDVYEWLKGQTDSEHFFALMIDKLRQEKEVSAPVMAAVMEATIKHTEELKKKAGVKELSYVNAVITDGKEMAAVRYVTGDPETGYPSTLYYSAGSKYECIDGVCRMKTTSDDEHAVMVASEKLTDNRSDWKEIPGNHVLLADRFLHTDLRPVKLK